MKQSDVPTEIRAKDKVNGVKSVRISSVETGTGKGKGRSLAAGSRNEDASSLSVVQEDKDRRGMQKKISRNSIIDKVPNAWQSDILDDTGQEVTGSSSDDTRLGRFLQFVEPVVMFLIIANAVMMGIATYDFVTDDPEMFEIFELVDSIFLILFTVEIILDTIHYLRLDRIIVSESTIGIKSGDIAVYKSCFDGQMKRVHFKPISNRERKERKSNFPWIIFDGAIVITSWAFSKFSVVRSFRILRTLRLINRIGPMRRVIGGIFAVSRKLMTVTWLLALLFCVFGVLFSQLFGNLYERGLTNWDYFGNFSLACLSCFQMMCFDQWHEIARATMEVYPWSWPLFVIWVVISGFIFMNFIIAVICDSLPESDKDDNIGHSGESIKEMERAQQAYKDHKFSQLHWILDDIQKEQEELLDTVEELGEIVTYIMEHDLGKKRKVIEHPPDLDRRKNGLFFGYTRSGLS